MFGARPEAVRAHDDRTCLITDGALSLINTNLVDCDRIATFCNIVRLCGNVDTDHSSLYNLQIRFKKDLYRKKLKVLLVVWSFWSVRNASLGNIDLGAILI